MSDPSLMILALLREWAVDKRGVTHGTLYTLQGPTGERGTLLLSRDVAAGKAQGRAPKNALAELRRELRRVGVQLNGDILTTSDEGPCAQEEALNVSQLAELGINVQPVKRVVIEMEQVDASVRGLASLLEMSPGAVEVFVDGMPLEGAQVLTFKVRAERAG